VLSPVAHPESLSGSDKVVVSLEERFVPVHNQKHREVERLLAMTTAEVEARLTINVGRSEIREKCP